MAQCQLCGKTRVATEKYIYPDPTVQKEPIQVCMDCYRKLRSEEPVKKATTKKTTSSNNATTKDKTILDVLNKLTVISENTERIKNILTFYLVLTIIGILILILSSCSVVFSI